MTLQDPLERITNRANLHCKPNLKIVAPIESLTRAQLIDIVAHPEVDEEEWVAACHELERRGEGLLATVDRKLRRKGQLALAGASFMVLLMIASLMAL